MKKENVLIKKLIFLVVMAFLSPHFLHSQVIDAAASLNSLSELKIEKQKMFPDSEIEVNAKSDSSYVIPVDKVSLDNPLSYEYRLDPVQIKAIFPEIVFKVEGEDIIDYYSLFPILFELINNQQKQIEVLKVEIEKLKQ